MNSDKIGGLDKVGKKRVYPKREPVVSTVSDIDFSGTYSYANYLRWQFDERLELIKGKVFEMAAPAPFRTVRRERCFLVRNMI